MSDRDDDRGLTVAGINVLGWIDRPHTDAQPPSADSVPGVEGNSRLTSATGIVLIALLAVEGVTILSVRQMITLHIFVGVLLTGPVLLKSATTMYRFVRYYRGTPAYVEKGPPPTLLRILGPLVVLSSFAVLGTGIALIFVGTSGSGFLLTAHQTCFWIWLVFMVVHVVGHVWNAAVTSAREVRSTLRGRAARGRRWRLGAIVVALVIGVGAATVILPSASSWINRPEGHHQLPPGAGR